MKSPREAFAIIVTYFNSTIEEADDEFGNLSQEVGEALAVIKKLITNPAPEKG